jgi:hypothetical protein
MASDMNHPSDDTPVSAEPSPVVPRPARAPGRRRGLSALAAFMEERNILWG